MTDTTSVLLVEDNPPDARFIEELFNEVQHGKDTQLGDVEIEHFESLADSLDAVDEGVDVVLLDLNLPDSSGMETVEAMLKEAPDLPIVVLTGVPESELGTRAVGTGAQDYLVKDDVTADSLVRTIRYAIERKEKERELRSTRDQLAVLNRLMRHDIRNDLSIVVGRTSELADYVDDDEGEEVLSEVLVAGHHVLELTRTIEEAVESITAPGAPTLTDVDVRPVLLDEIEKARTLYSRGEIVVEGGIPSVKVRGNGLLSSVFGNLVSNAMLYNDAEEPEVRIGVEVRDDVVRVTVADNGPGIPAHRADEIFQHGESGNDGGTGTGLFIVDRLVQQFGGDVSVETRGRGSTFVVTLLQA